LGRHNEWAQGVRNISITRNCFQIVEHIFFVLVKSLVLNYLRFHIVGPRELRHFPIKSLIDSFLNNLRDITSRLLPWTVYSCHTFTPLSAIQIARFQRRFDLGENHLPLAEHCRNRCGCVMHMRSPSTVKLWRRHSGDRTAFASGEVQHHNSNLKSWTHCKNCSACEYFPDFFLTIGSRDQTSFGS
jgi:hypothetical protein